MDTQQTTHPKTARRGPAPRAVRWMAVALLLGLLAVAVLVGVRLHARLQPLPPAPVPPLAVETRTIEPRPFVRWVRAAGTVAAERRVMLSAQLSATVAEVGFREGARVNAGAVLVRLDDAEQRQEVGRLQASAERVAADLAYWREQLAVDRKLVAAHTISRRAFDETARRTAGLEAALRETRQALARARTRLAYALLQAPFDGYVQAVRVLPGELVQPGKAMVELLAAEPLKAVVPVAETDVRALREGQPARVRVPALDGEWPGTVDRLYRALDPGTRSATVEVFLPLGLNGVRPGMAAEVAIERARSEAALLVPRQALRRRGGQTGVYVQAGGHAEWRTVQTGAAQDGLVEITQGLSAGDVLIVTPHPRLTEGRAVIARNYWRAGAP